jgi:hypothetical protein
MTTKINTNVGENYYFSTQINHPVQAIQDNGNGTIWCYTGHSYLTLDADKLTSHRWIP